MPDCCVLSHNEVWALSPAGWYRLNVDIAINMVIGCIFVGGLIRYNRSKFIGDFMMLLKFYTHFIVEL